MLFRHTSGLYLITFIWGKFPLPMVSIYLLGTEKVTAPNVKENITSNLGTLRLIAKGSCTHVPWWKIIGSPSWTILTNDRMSGLISLNTANIIVPKTWILLISWMHCPHYITTDLSIVNGYCDPNYIDFFSCGNWLIKGKSLCLGALEKEINKKGLCNKAFRNFMRYF